MKISHHLFLAFAVLVPVLSGCSKKEYRIDAPGEKISVLFRIAEEGRPVYSVFYSGSELLLPSALGLVRDDEDFSRQLKLDSVSGPEAVSDDYVLLHGKRKECSYRATRQIFHLSSENDRRMDIIFQVSDDGVAFRYFFPGEGDDLYRISEETSSFHLDPSAKAWMQHCPDSKTGWERTQPSYEEFYEQEIPVGTEAPFDAGWVLPALFNSGTFWISVTETAVDGSYCGSRLGRYSPGGNYRIQFPQATEGRKGEPVLPESKLPWTTPWRVIAVADNLATLCESTLGTDLAPPARYDVSSWLMPGRASWSWIIYKDGSINYDMQKKYIDFAASMNWKYCLVDVNWDRTIGYDRMKELAAYGAERKVKLLLWYNSAGDWNTVTFYSPHSRLLTHELRMEEFGRLQEMGIAGIKVDFFGGDGQSMMQYYTDILSDAAAHNLAVNFHGSTYPRGWARTWPNLVSMEAIRGEEFVTFAQENADQQPVHCTTIPFTRNLFDPMDFTPVNFSGIPGIQRRTTGGFEAALAVIFLSGIQHMAESPEGLAAQPAFIRDFLRDLPVSWDELKFIDGYPGKFVVLARRSGNSWYLAGINGENRERIIDIDPGFLQGNTTGMILSDSQDDGTLIYEEKDLKEAAEIRMKAFGGFVIEVK
ncbi:MAG: glycoside hydrolase family 97 catalytic domain-containing protein [Bacteroidota bacterium]